VSRTLAVHSRYDLFELWGLPSDLANSGGGDAHLCTEARARGYDTLQIAKRVKWEQWTANAAARSAAGTARAPWGDWAPSAELQTNAPPELILCDEQCMTHESRHVTPHTNPDTLHTTSRRLHTAAACDPTPHTTTRTATHQCSHTFWPK
jgi:hypothetical protein